MMAELQKWLCKLQTLLEIAHLGEIDVFFCLNVMLKMSDRGSGFCGQCLESACGLWIASLDWTCAMFSLLNLRTYVYLTGAMDSQSIAPCYITASHSVIVLTVHYSMSSSSHSSPYRLILTFFQCVCMCVRNVRWAWGDLCQVKTLSSFFLKEDARPECNCGHKAFFIQIRFPQNGWCEVSWYFK